MEMKVLAVLAVAEGRAVDIDNTMVYGHDLEEAV